MTQTDIDPLFEEIHARCDAYGRYSLSCRGLCRHHNGQVRQWLERVLP